MNEKTLKIIKIVSTTLLIIGAIAFTLAMGTGKSYTKETDKLTELLQLKDAKQQCVDWLTALQTQEYFKGTETYCRENDERIKTLKKELEEMISWYEYENIDRIIEEKKDKQTVEQETTALQKFEGLLASE